MKNNRRYFDSFFFKNRKVNNVSNYLMILAIDSAISPVKRVFHYRCIVQITKISLLSMQIFIY